MEGRPRGRCMAAAAARCCFASSPLPPGAACGVGAWRGTLAQGASLGIGQGSPRLGPGSNVPSSVPQYSPVSRCTAVDFRGLTARSTLISLFSLSGSRSGGGASECPVTLETYSSLLMCCALVALDAALPSARQDLHHSPPPALPLGRDGGLTPARRMPSARRLLGGASWR